MMEVEFNVQLIQKSSVLWQRAYKAVPSAWNWNWNWNNEPWVTEIVLRQQLPSIRYTAPRAIGYEWHRMKD